jgi:amino-acid N-acetyltransferase
VEIHPQPRRPEDDAAILALLKAEGLPTGDVSAEVLEGFVVARDLDGAVIAAAGLQVHGRFGLLRSLVVIPARRGIVLGKVLVEDLERRASAAGVGELFLLTTTAAGFFEALGYRRLDRAQVPPQISATAEFRSLCPASAICQAKRLGGTRAAV